MSRSARFVLFIIAVAAAAQARAYAAFVDNGTNDPAYVAANLAAKN